MNSTLVIARREIVEKRFIFVTALAFLALALIVPFMPGVHAGERAGALVLASLTLAAALTVGLSAILGASIIGRELADGRLSFYFSKPIPAASIWWGKLVAAALLVLAAFVIVGFPALLAGGSAATGSLVARQGTLAIFGGILSAATALFLLSHVISTFVRSRSAWFLFDFVAAVICGTAVWMLARPLAGGAAFELLWVLGRVFAAFLAVTVIAAGAWQVARGRTDRRRSHMELSRLLWVTIGCGVLVLAAYVLWVVSVRPANLKIESAAQPTGAWTFIEGPGKNRMDYHAAFLYNVDDGRSVRVISGRWVAFSGPQTALWLAAPVNGSEDLWIARLDAADPRPVQTRVAVTSPSFYNVSQDGSRFAAIDRHAILSAYDVASGDLLGSVRVPAGGYWFGYFVTPDVIRLYRNSRQKSTILEYDIRRKALTATGELPGLPFRFSEDHTRALVRVNDRIVLCDARSGAVVNSLSGGVRYPIFLRDGRIAAVAPGVLRIFSAEGSLQREIALGAPKPDFVTDIGGGRVVVALEKSSEVIDINRGTVVRTDNGIAATTFGGGSASHLLARTPDGFVSWNPLSGERRPIR